MDFSEKLEHAEDLFCDEKYDESERKFEQLLNENTDEAEKSVFNAMKISRQCTFASASFLAYSADAFLALKQGNDSEFERLRLLAMSYAAVGIDEREFEVVWLKNL